MKGIFVIRETLAFFGSLRKNMDTIGSLRENIDNEVII
jgi:hypothetical protein